MAKHTFLLSDESINSYGFLVRTEGIDTAVFEANPVMLYEHSALNLIGRWTNLRKDGTKLLADAEYDTDDDLAARVEKKVEKGILKGVSVGIQILEMGELVQNDGSTARTVLRSKLFEASICAMPSNSNALRLYNEKGQLVTPEAVTAYLSALQPQQQLPTDTPTDMKLTEANLKALGLDASATDEAINAAIARMAQQNADLGQKVKEQKDAAVLALVDGAIKDGRITADKKEHFTKLANTDFDATKAIVEGLAKQTKPTAMLGNAGSTATTTQGNDRDTWTFDQWRKGDPKGLLAMKSENPEAYARLLAGSSVHKSL